MKSSITEPLALVDELPHNTLCALKSLLIILVPSAVDTIARGSEKTESITSIVEVYYIHNPTFSEGNVKSLDLDTTKFWEANFCE